MNKLGFAIEIARAGLRTPLVCNDASWRNRVVDIREYLKLFDGLYHTDNIVTFISFDEGGCLLTQLKAISGKLGDFMSGWIYIPNTIDATGEDVMKAFNYVRNILSTMTSIESVKDEIISFFDKEYPQQEYAAAYTPSSGERFGVRYTDVPYTLKEILDSNRFQSYYNGHKAIFILETNGEVNISNDVASMFDDFTNEVIAKMAYLIPPSQGELQRIGRGVKIYTEDGKEFSSPVSVEQNSTVKLLLRKSGFEPIPFTQTITQNQEQVKLDRREERFAWKKMISPSMFNVSCGGGEKPNAQIRVNGTDVPFNGVSLEESACRNAVVKISAPGFDTWENTVDLTRGQINIVLQKSEMTFVGTIELSNGTYAEITLKSKDLPGGDSPIKGYTSNGDYRKPKLSFSPGYWKQRLIGFASAIILVFVVVLGIAVDSWFETHESRLGWPPYKEIKSEAKEVDPVSPSAASNKGVDEGLDSNTYSLEDAIKYLDGNDTWNKESMEMYQDLQGLFEAMNTYNFDEVKNIAVKLDNSKKLDAIKSAIETCKKNQGTPKKGDKDGKHVDTYNKPDDNDIIVNGYDKYVRNCKKKSGTDGSDGSGSTVSKGSNNGNRSDRGGGNTRGKGNKDL